MTHSVIATIGSSTEVLVSQTIFDSGRGFPFPNQKFSALAWEKNLPRDYIYRKIAFLIQELPDHKMS